MKGYKTILKTLVPLTLLASVAALPTYAAAQGLGGDNTTYLPIVTVSGSNTGGENGDGTYTVVDTGQSYCYDDLGVIACPDEGEDFHGQDAQYVRNEPRYVDNGDGTVTGLNTGLMWQKTPDTNGDGTLDSDDKVTFSEAVAGADTFELAGYDDWRLPTIKELYSLIDFDGIDTGPGDNSDVVPFIDTAYFDFVYGDESAGERIIDAQYWSATEYVSTTMGGMHTTFGVNFADGRIKGYGTQHPGGGEMSQFVRYVRGNTGYGENDFVDNGDGTITDNATGLMWQQADSGTGMDWEDSLGYCENLTTGGYDDWRLPDAKELQSIVDYTRSPDTTGSAAIAPLFSVSSITNEAGQADYPYFWTSTTHADVTGGSTANYISFGRAMGYWNDSWMDVHGAGAQRSEFKSGDPSDWPTGHGPQGDAIRIYNYARCVRSDDVQEVAGADPATAPATVDGGEMPRPPTGGDTGPNGGGEMRQPPREAIEACTGAIEGESCEMNTPRGTMEGTCRTIQGQTACVPPVGTGK